MFKSEHQILNFLLNKFTFKLFPIPDQIIPDTGRTLSLKLKTFSIKNILSANIYNKTEDKNKSTEKVLINFSSLLESMLIIK